MRKTAAFFISAVLMAVMLSGCGKEVAKTPKIDNLFTCKAEFSCNGFEGEANVSRLGDGMWDVEFAAPKTLEGVKLLFNNDEIKASYLGLSFTLPKESAPAQSALTLFFDAVDDTILAEEMESKQGETESKYFGENEAGAFEITVSAENGVITRVEIPSQSCVVDISEYAPIT